MCLLPVRLPAITGMSNIGGTLRHHRWVYYRWDSPPSQVCLLLLGLPANYATICLGGRELVETKRKIFTFKTPNWTSSTQGNVIFTGMCLRKAHCKAYSVCRPRSMYVSLRETPGILNKIVSCGPVCKLSLTPCRDYRVRQTHTRA